MIGQAIAHYRMTAKLGEGGMGEVYRATDTKLGREVAIKVLPEYFANDPDRMARFKREAHVLASLNHPNIAAIYAIEERAIVMELVEGETLKGPLPLDRAIHYAGQIADALEAAHEKGITHRDLKPANVKITPGGVVKVLDFGLAKITEPAGKPGNPLSSPTLTMGATEAGVILGTAAYMAPEQARGQTVDKRADIWAFGVVLWEMITGKQMFQGETVSDVLAQVLTNQPDLEAVPAGARPLLGACLEKDPRKRLRDIGDWKRLFQAAPREDRQRRSKLPWIAAACLALISAIALWALWRSPRRSADRPFLQVDLDLGPAEVSQPAISPDGMRIVFVSNGSLAMRRLDQTKITPLDGTDGARTPFFSPDGQWVAFFAGGKLKKIALEGGAPVVLCDTQDDRGGSWGDDGNIIASLHLGAGLYQIPATGGTPRPFTGMKTQLAGVHTFYWPQALPGGRGVLFTARDENSQLSLGAFTPSTGKLKTLVENSTYGRYLVTGYLVYYRSGMVLAAPMDAQRLELTGPAAPLVYGVSFQSQGQVDLDLSASGTLVYRRGIVGSNRIFSWLYSSGKIERLKAKPGNYLSPRLSPDGTRLAFVLDQDGQQDIWIYDISRDMTTRLTFDTELKKFPIWTPDGEFLTFYSGKTLAWTRADGSGKVDYLPSGNSTVIPWSFSPDAKWLAFAQVEPQTAYDLWTVPVKRTPGNLQLGQPQPLL